MVYCPGAMSPLSKHGGNQSGQTSQQESTLSVSKQAVARRIFLLQYQDRGRTPEIVVTWSTWRSTVVAFATPPVYCGSAPQP